MCVVDDDDDAAREVELGTRFNPAPLDDDIAAPPLDDDVLDLDLFRLAIFFSFLYHFGGGGLLTIKEYLINYRVGS